MALNEGTEIELPRYALMMEEENRIRQSERQRILDVIEKKKRFVPIEPETIEEIRNEGFNQALDEIKREVEK